VCEVCSEDCREGNLVLGRNILLVQLVHEPGRTLKDCLRVAVGGGERVQAVLDGADCEGRLAWCAQPVTVSYHMLTTNEWGRALIVMMTGTGLDDTLKWVDLGLLSCTRLSELGDIKHSGMEQTLLLVSSLKFVHGHAVDGGGWGETVGVLRVDDS
jgi:hypothetical protein